MIPLFSNLLKPKSGLTNAGMLVTMAGKVTFDTVRKIASALPGVEESTSYGVPSFKIGGQLMACPAINKSAEPNSLVMRIDFDQRDALF